MPGAYKYGNSDIPDKGGRSRNADAGQAILLVVDIAENTTPEAFAKVLTLYKNLLGANKDFPGMDPNQRGNGWPEEDNGYVAGKWAMVPMGPWIWGHRADNETARVILEEQTGIAALPIPEGGVQATYLEVKPIMVNKAAADVNAAWELAKFITSRDATATAPRAVYDVVARTIRLTGAVVLAQGGNTLKGTDLLVDLKAGTAVLTGKGAPGGRVEGVLQPGG